MKRPEFHVRHAITNWYFAGVTRSWDPDWKPTEDKAIRYASERDANDDARAVRGYVSVAESKK